MEHAPFFELKPNPMAIKSLYNTDQGLFPKGKSAQRMTNWLHDL